MRPMFGLRSRTRRCGRPNTRRAPPVRVRAAPPAPRAEASPARANSRELVRRLNRWRAVGPVRTAARTIRAALEEVFMWQYKRINADFHPLISKNGLHLSEMRHTNSGSRWPD